MWEKGEIIGREEGISGCPLIKVYNELIKGAGGMPLQEFIIINNIVIPSYYIIYQFIIRGMTTIITLK